MNIYLYILLVFKIYFYMKDKSILDGTLNEATDMGLLVEEYENICDILNRAPNYTELCIFSVMWSEHCSYKNSIFWLKTLPKDGQYKFFTIQYFALGMIFGYFVVGNPILKFNPYFENILKNFL